jgi:Amidohydrolase family
MRYTLCSIAIALVALSPVRGGVDEDFVVIKAGRVITVSGEEFSPGVVVIEDGKISAVGGDLEYPSSAKVIRAPHETVMPGLIHPRSRFGLGKYTRGGVQGDKHVTDEIDLSQMRFDDLLEAGFVAVAFVPSGTAIPGIAATYRTAGPDDSRLLDENSYLHVVPKWRSGGRKMLGGALKKANDEIEKVKKAREEWDKKQKEKAEKEAAEDNEEDAGEDADDDSGDESYKDDDDSDSDKVDDSDSDADPDQAEEKKEEKFEPPKIDPKHQPLVDLIQKKDGARMMVAITRTSDLLHFDAVMEPYEDLSYSLYLATSRSSDYHLAVDKLGEREATVLLRPWTHYMPYTTFRYNLMNRLSQAGCSVAVTPMGDSRDELLRLRSRLADLLRTGLSREAALKAMTLNAAKAIGLDDKLGSLEKDKFADLTFFDGDPLDPHSKVTRVMILGEIVWKKDKKLAGRN